VHWIYVTQERDHGASVEHGYYSSGSIQGLEFLNKLDSYYKV
jgi:hypothetical protein